MTNRSWRLLLRIFLPLRHVEQLHGWMTIGLQLMTLGGLGAAAWAFLTNSPVALAFYALLVVLALTVSAAYQLLAENDQITDRLSGIDATFGGLTVMRAYAERDANLDFWKATVWNNRITNRSGMGMSLDIELHIARKDGKPEDVPIAEVRLERGTEVERNPFHVEPGRSSVGNFSFQDIFPEHDDDQDFNYAKQLFDARHSLITVIDHVTGKSRDFGFRRFMEDAPEGLSPIYSEVETAS